MNKRVRIAISGAAGQIGYALLFRIASGQMFGPHVDIELNLLELEQSMPALQGVEMELLDCAFPRLKNITLTSDLKTAMDGVNWALLVGSVPRKQGMERSDLLQINGNVFVEQGRAINNYASSDVRVFVVGNPCNTNCLIAKHHAPDVPASRFFAMTALDELRARNQLAIKANVDIEEISQMMIWGNHSATQFPDFYHAKIDGRPALQVIADEAWFQEEFVPSIQQRGAAVIKARGASSAASAANGVMHSIQMLSTDTPEGELFSVALSSQGQYGVDEGLIFSFPARNEHGFIRSLGMEQSVVEVVEGFGFETDYAKHMFERTLNELREERDMVKSLGLLA